MVLRVRDRRLECLLWQRAKAPFDGQWSLPRGSLGATERLGTSASIGFALAPAAFTIAQLRDIYVASLGHPVSATNLQRILTRRGVIQPTAGTVPPTAAGGRPAALYEFVSRSLVVTNAFAAFRPLSPHPSPAPAA